MPGLRALILAAAASVVVVAASQVPLSRAQPAHRQLLLAAPQQSRLGPSAPVLTANPVGGIRYFRSVTSASPRAAWAIGSDEGPTYAGFILKTTDWGATWQRQLTTPELMTSISAVSESLVYAVAGNYVLTTRDGGATWSAQALAHQDDFLGPLTVASPTVAWVGGGSAGPPAIYKTTDTGDTWSPQPFGSFGFRPNAIAAASENVAWAVGGGCTAHHSGVIANGTIVVTRDGGTTWTAQVAGGCAGFEGVVAASEQVAWVVGDQGHVLHTVDGGTTWRRVATGLASFLRHAAVPAESVDPAMTLWASGVEYEPDCCGRVHGVVVFTDDGGATWAKARLERAGNFWGLTFQGGVGLTAASICLAAGCTNQGVTIRPGA